MIDIEDSENQSVTDVKQKKQRP
jgi:hypothetical protein